MWLKRYCCRSSVRRPLTHIYQKSPHIFYKWKSSPAQYLQINFCSFKMYDFVNFIFSLPSDLMVFSVLYFILVLNAGCWELLVLLICQILKNRDWKFLKIGYYSRLQLQKSSSPRVIELWFFSLRIKVKNESKNIYWSLTLSQIRSK